ncbi:MAG: K(+)-stimulated pyrophosphate-energized sodium pump [Candidatus Methanofastidiosum methylothiophilum]|uniref:K(+)-insensitive pyrophosphate-energized proton pump n=1 Tax=Candidatus Methanofastidiosum methylothiophilum TaxID=1705564 RepID=A0A150IM78_9EURY|nr:MAG: K(+)-stimulated pyrophosphate-energized sodium pump [Candidatus Methanofastidiosum methylthiophilus]KYC48759.1 MAG: K(+)-stimulated pyrophosphate-energized sodium pump [Candidatus Methanofastidiosum methylthiophilus]KYC51407.1 MAG: K(+)-stimulated pyrophosphate-energized sodium pump [Candidatus Methanofastidiosum methylthiophilus]
MDFTLIAILIGIVGIIYGLSLAKVVLSYKVTDKNMLRISSAIYKGAMAFLRREYTTIAIIAAILAVVFGIFINIETTVTFIVGAVFSALAGFIGMSISTRANVRVASIAKEGVGKALRLSFQGGAVTGMTVAGLALLGVSGFYYLYRDPALIIGFGFGGCLISLFARIGGGIYTKAADVGADLIGKVEQGIPEDDPRNPAVIADNVGDNVGDCAGMGADLFETYAVTAIGAMLLGVALGRNDIYVIYPLILGAIGIIGSILGSFFVRGKDNIMKTLYKGVIASAVISLVGFYFVTVTYLKLDIALFLTTVVGIVIALLMFFITEYYTAKPYRPVRSIAHSSQSGAAVNIITGLAVGMESTLMPVLVICAGILISHSLAGLYGIAIAAMSMISLTAIVVALDSYGPITDNAGGIAEMAHLPDSIRKTTDALDSVGNTTKAVTKAFAIGSAALASLTLFAAYVDEIARFSLGQEIIFSLSDEKVIVGLFLGALIPFLFSSLCMRAVGKAAFSIVEEVRRQFREIKGIMEGKTEPDYARCVDIVTRASLKELVLPGIIAVLSPLLVGFLLGKIALGGMLIGSILSGFLLALMLATGGGAWDNAKKYIEDGNLGGKGSPAHAAAVVGDTVGDPSKDTAGPAINPLIKVMNTLAIIFAVLFGSGII